MDSFCSLLFLGVFLPATLIAYGAAPCRLRPGVLLAASYLCFWLISGGLLALLLATTLITYVTGLALGREQERTRATAKQLRDRRERRALKHRSQTRMRLMIGLAAAISIGILVVVKYLGFLGEVGESVGELVGADWELKAPRLGIPIGISFYTLQALSYLFDIYRASLAPERNLGRFALYMSFFPQLMEGPICRYAEMAPQLAAGNPIRTGNLLRGLLRIAWGVAKIMIVAFRLNLFVQPVFEKFWSWDGTVVAVAAVLYTLQLYCDFSGTMDIVLGVGRIFGMRLPENFRQPLLSRTASEFWQRWHITLGAWLRDYVFYPVSLSAPVKAFARVARRAFSARTGSVLSGGIALFCVWTINGLWHGSGWQYLLFGMYYFVIILTSGLLEPVFARLRGVLRIDADAPWWHAVQIVRTVVIVCIGELIFRADGVIAGATMLESLVTDFSLASFVDGTLLEPGMDVADFVIVILFAIVLFGLDIARERGVMPPRPLIRHGALVSCGAIAALCLAAIIFGAYGDGYIPLDPIYAQF